MQIEIKKIISDIFVDNELQQIKTTEQDIVGFLGKNFLKKNIKTIYWNNKKIIIQTNSIEAKTEINLIKTKLQKNEKIKIK